MRKLWGEHAACKDFIEHAACKDFIEHAACKDFIQHAACKDFIEHAACKDFICDPSPIHPAISVFFYVCVCVSFFSCVHKGNICRCRIRIHTVHILTPPPPKTDIPRPPPYTHRRSSCQKTREGFQERRHPLKTPPESVCVCVCVCECLCGFSGGVCVCVRERERERESVCLWVSVWVFRRGVSSKDTLGTP